MAATRWLRSALSRVLMVVVAMVAAPDAFADGLDAEQRLRDANDRLREVLASDPTAEEVGEIVNGLLYYEGLSSRALRNHWSGASEERREEFLSLFRSPQPIGRGPFSTPLLSVLG